MVDAPPRCIAIILDGNRRWAAQQGLPKLEGHRRGLVDTLKKTILAVRDRNIQHLAVFMFSTENWNRDSEEVSYLMDLFSESLESHLLELVSEGIRIRFIGQRERFSERIQNAMSKIEEDSSSNSRLTFWACLSYGGRAEIVEAVRLAASKGEITETSLEESLWSAEMPEPDILIRTGGEKRLSGFLTWKSVYSELFFIDDFWPDFSESHLDAILSEYGSRERRMGR
jgi:undecaprenyl diphosphate synthase